MERTTRSPSTLLVRPATAPGDRRAARVLLAEYVGWLTDGRVECLDELQPDIDDELADPCAHYAGDRGLLLIARVDGVAAGSVALRWWPDGTAELKRLYVRPTVRGLGVGDALVDTAVAAARTAGRSRVVLETVEREMPLAARMYRRRGFVEIEPFSAPAGRVDGLVAMSLDLGPDAGAG